MICAGPHAVRANVVQWGACCFTRARARYWRIARGYFGLGVALGVSIGMVLGALAVRP